LASLRDRKKEAARHRIIAVADHLFAEDGFDATTMEDIAAAAEVSVGTLYNYFGSKTAILLAAVEEDTEELLKRGSAVVAEPGTDPVAAVQRLISTYAEAFSSWDRGLLQEVMSVAFRRGGAELTRELAELDMRIVEQMVAFLTPFQERGAIRSDLALEEVALLLYSILGIHLFIYLSMEGITESALLTQLNRQISIAFEGLASHEQKANYV
jgi:AcrR family transcriptional regulator